nr:VOC family protein [uncultured Oscillibacter sp.]
MENYCDFQLLLYVSAELYPACIQFYEQVFQVKPFYKWDDGENDRGQKYDIAGAKLVILTQENPFPEYGPAHFQVETDDIIKLYTRVRENKFAKVTQEPFMRPYGWHMFRLEDPAGNHINIYSIPQ